MNAKTLDIMKLMLKQIAFVSGAIAFLAALTLGYLYFTGYSGNIKDSPVLLEIKKELEKAPADQTLIAKFRELDKKERAFYFATGEHMDFGALVLIIFGLLFAFTLRGKSLLLQRIPKVKKGSGSVFSAGKKGGDIYLVSTIITATVSICLLLLAAYAGYERQSQKKEENSAAAKIDLSKSWNAFRGPSGDGIVIGGNYLTSWNVKTGEGVLWKTMLLAKGYSSPIVFKNKLFLTGSIEKVLKVLCYDALTGKELWVKSMLVPIKDEDFEIMSEDSGGAGYAAPTPVTDGEFVYVYFASNNIACYDYEGNQIWVKFLGKPENTYGISSSPLLYNDKVVLQIDQSGNLGSRLVALNKKTGNISWETKRPEGQSWGSPVLIEHAGRKQVITTGNPLVISYDPDTGKEIWRAECLDGEISTTAIYAEEKIFVMSVGSSSTLFAIIPDGNGDVTKTKIAWQLELSGQAINAPVSDGKTVAIAMGGFIEYVDIATGKKLSEFSVEDDFWASPVLVNGNVFVPSQRGNIYIARRDKDEIKVIPMEEKCSPSPAFLEDKIYVRTEKTLYCIGVK